MLSLKRDIDNRPAMRPTWEATGTGPTDLTSVRRVFLEQPRQIFPGANDNKYSEEQLYFYGDID
jgi:hypothetical protein